MGKIEIKRFDVVSVGKIYAVMGAIGGFFAGLIMATLGSIFGSLAEVGAIGMAGFGILSIIAFPIIYAIGGFVIGVIAAFIYNIIAERFGSIVFENK
jgi:hypothetical protein